MSNYLHKYLRILKVEDTYRQQVITFVNNCLQKRLTAIFHDYFRQRTADYHIRNPGLDIDYGRTNIGYLSVKNTGARLWNNISNELKAKGNQLNFRKHIATYYLATYN